MFAAIFRSKNTAAFASQIGQRAGTAFKTLHDRHHDICFTGANRQTDPPGLGGQAAAQFFPSRTAIGAFENSGDIFATTGVRSGSETPGRALSRVERCVNGLRSSWVENH